MGNPYLVHSHQYSAKQAGSLIKLEGTVRVFFLNLPHGHSSGILGRDAEWLYGTRNIQKYWFQEKETKKEGMFFTGRVLRMFSVGISHAWIEARSCEEMQNCPNSQNYLQNSIRDVHVMSLPGQGALVIVLQSLALFCLSSLFWHSSLIVLICM